MVYFQRHPTDRFGGISVRKTCNRLKFSVREMSSGALLTLFRPGFFLLPRTGGGGGGFGGPTPVTLQPLIV